MSTAPPPPVNTYVYFFFIDLPHMFLSGSVRLGTFPRKGNLFACLLKVPVTITIVGCTATRLRENYEFVQIPSKRVQRWLFWNFENIGFDIETKCPSSLASGGTRKTQTQWQKEQQL